MLEVFHEQIQKLNFLNFLHFVSQNQNVRTAARRTTPGSCSKNCNPMQEPNSLFRTRKHPNPVLFQAILPAHERKQSAYLRNNRITVGRSKFKSPSPSASARERATVPNSFFKDDSTDEVVYSVLVLLPTPASKLTEPQP